MSRPFCAAPPVQAPPPRPHNVVLFVADGLRSRWSRRNRADHGGGPREGVICQQPFAVSDVHHRERVRHGDRPHVGDTGDFSNTIYTGFPVARRRQDLTPFLESDPVLGDVDEHFAGNYLDEATILKLARDKGISTASIGKVGPR